MYERLCHGFLAGDELISTAMHASLEKPCFCESPLVAQFLKGPDCFPGALRDLTNHALRGESPLQVEGSKLPVRFCARVTHPRRHLDRLAQDRLRPHELIRLDEGASKLGEQRKPPRALLVKECGGTLQEGDRRSDVPAEMFAAPARRGKPFTRLFSERTGTSVLGPSSTRYW